MYMGRQLVLHVHTVVLSRYACLRLAVTFFCHVIYDFNRQVASREELFFLMTYIYDWIYGNRSKLHIGSYEIIDFKDFNTL